MFQAFLEILWHFLSFYWNTQLNRPTSLYDFPADINFRISSRFFALQCFPRPIFICKCLLLIRTDIKRIKQQKKKNPTFAIFTIIFSRYQSILQQKSMWSYFIFRSEFAFLIKIEQHQAVFFSK